MKSQKPGQTCRTIQSRLAPSGIEALRKDKKDCLRLARELRKANPRKQHAKIPVDLSRSLDIDPTS